MSEEMVKLAQEITMKKTPVEAFGTVLRDYLDRKIADCEKEIRKYEEKYGMSFEEFDEKVTNDKSFHDEIERKYGVVQAENDYFEWGGVVSSLKYFQERLKKLNECR